MRIKHSFPIFNTFAKPCNPIGMVYKSYYVYSSELAPGTISSTGDRVHGNDSKQYTISTLQCTDSHKDIKTYLKIKHAPLACILAFQVVSA